MDMREFAKKGEKIFARKLTACEWDSLQRNFSSAINISNRWGYKKLGFWWNIAGVISGLIWRAEMRWPREQCGNMYKTLRNKNKHWLSGGNNGGQRCSSRCGVMLRPSVCLSWAAGQNWVSASAVQRISPSSSVQSVTRHDTLPFPSLPFLRVESSKV